MYGWQQECARQEALRVEQEDLEKRLAEIYGGLEGGAERCADLTAPHASALLRSGAVRPLPQLAYEKPPKIAAAGDLVALSQAAFSADDESIVLQNADDRRSSTAAEQLQHVGEPAQLAVRPSAAARLHNRAIGVEPAGRRMARGGSSSAAEDEEAAATPGAFRDMEGVD